jgi:putative FmdB family regulatory protein
LPLYEYRCTQCGHRFEKIQRFDDEPEHQCPQCQGPLVRPLTAPAFQFKGSGWYVNDYASKSSAPASDSPAAAAPAEAKKPAAASQSATSTPSTAAPPAAAGTPSGSAA